MLNKNTRRELRELVLDDLTRHKIPVISLKYENKGRYPVSYRLISDLLHNCKKPATWKPNKQILMLKHFKISDQYYLEDDSYIKHKTDETD